MLGVCHIHARNVAAEGAAAEASNPTRMQHAGSDDARQGKPGTPTVQGLPCLACTVAHCAAATPVLLVGYVAMRRMTTLLPSHHHYAVSLVLYC